jgi:hypothetical protein
VSYYGFLIISVVQNNIEALKDEFISLSSAASVGAVVVRRFAAGQEVSTSIISSNQHRGQKS